MLHKAAHCWITHLWMLIVACVASVALLPSVAFATPASCAQNSTDDQLLYTLIECTKIPLREAAEDMVNALNAQLAPAIAAAILLAVVILGVKIATGMAQAKTEIVLTSIKIVLVSFFSVQFVTLLPDIWNIMDELVEAVTEVVRQGVFSCGGYGGAGTSIWEDADCMLGSIFGFGIVNTMFSGMLGLIVGMLLGGPENGEGYALQGFMTGIFFVMSFFLTFVRAIMFYIMAMMAITFLVALSPLFIPMVLFNATKSYFKKWYEQILSYMLQHIFVIGLLAFALTIFGSAVYTGQHSLSGIIFVDAPGLENCDAGTIVTMDDWNRCMEGAIQAYSSQCSNIEGSGAVTTQLDDLFPTCSNVEASVQNAAGQDGDRQCLQEFDEISQALGAERMMEGFMGQVGGLMNFVAVFECVNIARPVELLIHLIAIVVMAIILHALLGSVSDMARDAVSSFSQVNLEDAALPGEDLMKNVATPETFMNFFSGLKP